MRVIRRYKMAETTLVPEAAATASPSAPGRPHPSGYGQPAAHGGAPVKRQIVCFSFYKLMPEWRRLPAGERAAHKQAFADVLAKWDKPGEFLTLTYSTIGTRGDVDMCVWSIGYAVDEMSQMRAEL